MGAAVYAGGFADAPRDAAHAFRAAMNVMARPGEIRELSGAVPPAPLSVAQGALILTLADPETGLFLAGAADCQDVRAWITFHTGAPIVGREHADFAIGSWADLMPLDDYRIGTAEYPDRSTTLVAELPSLAQDGAVLRGPGIKDTARLTLPDVPALQRNAALYPLGFDCFFTSGTKVAALPRSTKIAEG